ncbi:MAG: SusC/RagA family TonB-linked outer membrane protein [Mucilaginibacter sp.]|nr:SusC/RagA family TonB-linked outer membrane protein [Mucilaginibacter sp.]
MYKIYSKFLCRLHHHISKLLLTMKLTIILLIATMMQVSATTFAQKLSLKKEGVTLKQVFKEIKKQTGYDVLYQPDKLKANQKINADFNDTPLEEVMKTCLQRQSLIYTFYEKTIVIKAAEKSMISSRPVSTGLTSAAIADISVSGTVSDKTGPLPGVSVFLKSTNKALGVTNIKGAFNVTVPENAILIFKYIGYKTLEVPVNGSNVLNVILEETNTSLNEVVVIGYGTKKRKYLTGAVSSVGSEVFESRPTSNALSALQGEIPGMVIERSTGQPGAEGFSLNVRGYSSTNGGNSPLVLVDGIPGDLNLLNPDDIQSIDVLKDASASIYGARAANGVFIVTTKRGKKGKPIVSYSGNAAITKESGMMKSPTNYQMALMDNEANIHNGSAPMYTADLLQRIRNNDPNPIDHPLYGGWKLFFTNTDWVKAVLGNGFQQKHNVNISGGGENSTYYLSGGYADQKGVIKYADNGNKRYNLRLNYDYDFAKWLRLETKVSIENQDRTDIGGVGSSGLITEAIFGMPNVPVYNKEGEFFAQGGWGNAVAEAKQAATSTFNTRNLNTNFKLTADVATGLKLNLQAGVNYSSENDNDIAKSVPLYNWDGNLAYYAIANPSQSSLSVYNSHTTYHNYTGYLQYSKKLWKKHEIDFMAGASHEESNFDWFNARRDNFISQDVWALNLGGTNNMSNAGGGNHWGINSLFSRFSYAYDNKYMLEANLRYDGSSRFEPGHQYGLFPGVSVGWRISQEKFLKDVQFLSDLKLRASYGQTGNQEGIGLYDYLQLINVGGSYPFGAGGQTQAATLAGMVSTNRTWERLINKNIGLDASLFNSKLNFSFDYFIKNNKNLLIPVTYPSILGSVAPYSNSGELKTWGFETSIAYKDKVGKFNYSARVIVSDAQNKVINYGGADTYVPGLNTIRQGYPINTYFAYVFDGLIRNQQELDAYKKLDGVPSDIQIGDARFKDLNGDGKISAYGNKPGDNGDVENVGTISPRYNFGINLTANYSNFDISIFLQGVGKRTLFRTGEYSIPWSDWWRQPPEFYFNQTWNADRPNAKYPELSNGNIRYWNYQPSTLQKVNGAYIRLKNLTIGYSLPKSLLEKTFLSRARVYVGGQDLWEKDSVLGGWDPEASQSGFNYPFQRFFSFGLDITLK